MNEFGRVTFFDGHEDKLFGFIEPDDGRSFGVFFHVAEYRNPATKDWLQHIPIEGDRVAFRSVEGRAKRPRADAWTYESEFLPRLRIGEPLHLNLDHLPVMAHRDLTCDDVCVGSLDANGSWGHGPRATWVDIILRTRTGELFQIRCWEGDCGGETTQDLPFQCIQDLTIEVAPRRAYKKPHKHAKSAMRAA